mmetsp:Transcript_16024/g.32561  ORF Transcript_16024/g.32561 Transcript_16024/m.32561 type:complete len:209 (+) Transcript_16024:529-1155(+)
MLLRQLRGIHVRFPAVGGGPCGGRVELPGDEGAGEHLASELAGCGYGPGVRHVCVVVRVAARAHGQGPTCTAAAAPVWPAALQVGGARRVAVGHGQARVVGSRQARDDVLRLLAEGAATIKAALQLLQRQVRLHKLLRPRYQLAENPDTTVGDCGRSDLHCQEGRDRPPDGCSGIRLADIGEQVTGHVEAGAKVRVVQSLQDDHGLAL